jgi:hypothetical protein
MTKTKFRISEAQEIKFHFRSSFNFKEYKTSLIHLHGINQRYLMCAKQETQILKTNAKLVPSHVKGQAVLLFCTEFLFDLHPAIIFCIGQ